MAVAKGVTRLEKRLRNIVNTTKESICAGTVKRGT